MNIVIEWMFKNLLIDSNSLSDFDKAVYISAYNSKDAMRSSNAWYQAVPQDIEDNKAYDKLTMPVIGIGGSGYEMLKISLPNAASDLQLKEIKESGHFILAEKPNETANLIIDFLDKP